MIVKTTGVNGLWQGECSKMSEWKFKGPDRKREHTPFRALKKVRPDYCREQKGINQGLVRSRTCD